MSDRLEDLKKELIRQIRTTDRSKDSVWFAFLENLRPRITYEEEEALQEIVDAEE